MENNHNETSGAAVFAYTFIKIFSWGMAIVFALVVMLLLIPTKSDKLSDEIKQARDALTLHYIQRGIYDPVRCDIETIKEQSFVLCRASASTSNGGLYALQESAHHSLTISPVNGKAYQHIKGVPEGSYDGSELKAVPLVKNVNIQNVLSHF